jgi:uncharacterized protein YggU (UPF0235/DUF167 family)
VGGRWGDDDVLTVAVTARAAHGAATDAVCVAVARAFGLRRRDVEVVSGERSRTKLLDLEIDGATGRARLARLLEQ